MSNRPRATRPVSSASSAISDLAADVANMPDAAPPAQDITHPDNHRVNSEPDPLAVFTERCWARAILCRNGLFDFTEAIDGLQAAAIESGVVERIGQDAVQRLMADAFRPIESPPLAPEQPRVPQSTRDAYAYLVQLGDVPRLARWLAERPQFAAELHRSRRCR